MATPAVVKAQAEEADRIHAQLYGAKDEQEEKAGGDPADDRRAEEAGGESPAPVPEVLPDSPDPAQAEPTKPVKEETWEHRYQTLAGKYDTEIPQMAAELKDTQDMMAAMSQQAPLTPIQAGEALTTEEVEEYGEELVSVMRKAARAEMAPFIQQMQEQTQSAQERMNATAESIAVRSKDQFWRTLNQLVPDWETLNKTQNFLDWLKTPDVYSGQSRQDMLTQAVEANDIYRTVAFFNGYKQEQTGQLPVTPDPSTAQGFNLETLVAPGRPAGTVATGAQTSGKVWTEAQVERFTRDKMAGKIPAADAARIDQEIHHAAMTGRLRKA